MATVQREGEAKQSNELNDPMQFIRDTANSRINSKRHCEGVSLITAIDNGDASHLEVKLMFVVDGGFPTDLLENDV